MEDGPGKRTATSPSAVAFMDRKERRREEARLRKKVQQLEAKVEKLEAVLADTDKRFAAPDYFQMTPWPQVQEEQRVREEQAKVLRATVAEWESSAQELEALQQAS
jgi:BMFP domain-containing protein YqiC